MRHLFSTRVRVILIIAILLTAGLAVVSNATGQSIPDIAVRTVLAPFRYAVNALTEQAEQYYSYMFKYESLVAENEALKEQIAQMQDEARRADSVTRENERLRDLLNLQSTNEDYELVDANIISWSSNDWTNTFMINRGTSAGIEEDMCAVTATGEVVGLVTEAGPNAAVVNTVLDSTLEISTIIASSGYNGMVSGGYIYKQENHLKMDYLPSSAVIRNNDQVVTSGSTVYPRNLIVGYVVDAGFDDTGVAKYAILRPAVEIGRLEQVFILTNYTTSIEEEAAAANQDASPTE